LRRLVSIDGEGHECENITPIRLPRYSTSTREKKEVPRYPVYRVRKKRGVALLGLAILPSDEGAFLVKNYNKTITNVKND
jgi:hypothetical protein